MDLGLAGATVVINGGSKGMGRAAAEAIAAEGARVAVLARGKEALDDTAEALVACGAAEALRSPTDITDRAQVESTFAQLADRWGQPQRARQRGRSGRRGHRPVRRCRRRRVGRHVRHRHARRRPLRPAALPLLRRAEWARIVNVSAHSTRRQSPDIVAYTAAKAALTSLSKNLSVGLASEGILVNTVSPGSFLSAGMKGYLAALPPERGIDPDDLHDAMKVIAEDFGHPANLGRAGDPREIGPVIAFVASRVNSYMTGADINVDGGSDF